MMRRSIILQLLLIVFLVVSCDQGLIHQEYENNPVDVFETLWWEFDQLYALFEVKQVNWDSLYAVYRPQVKKSMTDGALYDVLRSLLAHLNDNHVLLFAEGLEVFRAGSLDQMPAYFNALYAYFETDLNRYFYVVRNRYLAEGYRSRSGDIPSSWGQIDTDWSGTSSIGYIHPGNGGTGDIDFVQTIFDELSEMDGLIIDLRFSGGSNERLAIEVASYCTDQKRLYMVSRTRNGPAHNDFDEPDEGYIQPVKSYFGNPIVLLTNRYTMDSAEELFLAMKLLPQVTIIGDTTAGAFSSVLTRDLPNGWRYTLPKSVVYAQDGTCFEGIGLVPDLIARNSRDELLKSKDSPLEAAIALLK